MHNDNNYYKSIIIASNFIGDACRFYWRVPDPLSFSEGPDYIYIYMYIIILHI